MFTIELIPSEAIFYEFIFGKEHKHENNKEQQNNVDLNTLLNGEILQMGGNETTGSGFIKLKINK